MSGSTPVWDSRHAVGGGLCLAVPGYRVVCRTADPSLLAELGELARKAAPVRDVLSRVPDAEAPGGADWAILVADGAETWLLLRGAVSATVCGADSELKLQGSLLTAWSEFRLPADWGSVTVLLDDEHSQAKPEWLPLQDGLGRGAGWSVRLSAATRSEAPSGADVPSPTHLTINYRDGAASDAAVVEVLVPPVVADPELAQGEDDSGLLRDDLHQLIWGATESRGVWDAAGSEDGQPDSVSALGPDAVVLPQSSVAESNVLDALEAVPLPLEPAVAPMDLPPSPRPPVSRTASPSTRQVSGLIDSISWGVPPSPALQSDGDAPDGRASLASVGERVVLDARPNAKSGSQPAYSESDGDADGDLELTVRPHRLVPRATDELSVQVLAADCPDGHPNPPSAQQCRVCGQHVPYQDPVRRIRPALGSLRLSTNETIVLDRDVLLGRKPQVPPSARPRPHVVQFAADAEGVSRTHLKLTLDEWDVLATDLSSFGTFLELPGREPEQLEPKQPHPLVPGSRLWLADDIWALFEVTE